MNLTEALTPENAPFLWVLMDPERWIYYEPTWIDRLGWLLSDWHIWVILGATLVCLWLFFRYADET